MFVKCYFANMNYLTLLNCWSIKFISTCTVFKMLILFSAVLHGSVLPENERIFELKQAIAKRDIEAVNNMEYLSIFIRFPSSWTPEKDKLSRKNKLKSVRGVLAFSCVGSAEDEPLKNLDINYHYRSTLEYADRNNLAVIAWRNFRGYAVAKDVSDYSKEELKKYNDAFELRTRYWEKAYKRLILKFNLPDRDTIMYGISGGAQIAHRLAIRYPEYFSGVFMHISSSYDLPTNRVSRILWFVSTGELDAGYKSAEIFYKNLLDVGACAIFKAIENLAHDSTPQVDKLRLLFYDYLLTFIPDLSNPEWQKPPIDKFYLMKYPIYIGDYLNQIAYPSAEATKYIEHSKMVALPTKPLAEAWGTIFETK